MLSVCLAAPGSGAEGDWNNKDEGLAINFLTSPQVKSWMGGSNFDTIGCSNKTKKAKIVH